jgi:hypothetical protein
MINQDTMYNVKNRSSSVVVYRIPETNLRREFAPGETKRVPFSELEKLTFQQGGRELLENFLQILEEEVTTNLNVNREVEYNMNEQQIAALLQTGSLDAFLDALDFAPIGVIDLIKTMAVQLPLTDMNKRKALKEKTGFDVDRALVHIEEEKAEIAQERQQNAEMMKELLALKAELERKQAEASTTPDEPSDNT